ncbi:IncP-type conjugal transfer protein TrbI [Roseibium sp. Sym1]|uniref:IncP-type conjugal transfer protein TrbI n=1 Tax=Roseibium sp. Sym1 TaxID=3016006 RepID=UPI0022B4F703|nr:IncP-type conjugal transfer protein TrbI [Roseibium sp. Sym1]
MNNSDSNVHLAGGDIRPDDAPKIRRLNKLPIFLFVGLVVVFGVVIIIGLANRGINSGDNVAGDEGGAPASGFADQLKAGISNGVIDPPSQLIAAVQPDPVRAAVPETVQVQRPFGNPFQPEPGNPDETIPPQQSEPDWRAQLDQRFEEQQLQEMHRQRMKRLQSIDAAHDSPTTVNLSDLQGQGEGVQTTQGNQTGNGTFTRGPTSPDLLSAALQAAQGGTANADPNGQYGKQAFFNQDISEAGYLANRVVPQQSPYELKRGSVIPATLITGINSDLPGRITGQVRQNVYDSATGHMLLIPQGTKLFGRYDSDVSFGQNRVLVVWTDIVFPNGATLQIGSMGGVDGEGYGGFKDKVNNHYLRTFGSAALLAIIGTGIDMAVPESSTLATQETASDAARRNFAEVFGRVVERTISKNLDVQPTLQIRPGYNFNILVDQDIIFPGKHS